MSLIKLLLPIIFTFSLGGCTYTNILSGESTISYENSDKYIDGNQIYTGGNSIKNIKISWISGKIEVFKTSDTRFRFEETPLNSHENIDKLVLRTYLTKETAYVQFGYPGTYNLNNFSKNLKVYVPNYELSEIKINTIAGETSVEGFEAANIEQNSTSASLKITNSIVKTIELNAVSGTLEANTETINYFVYTTSGSANIINSRTENANVEMGTVSGNLNYTLKDGVGFKATLNSVSGRFYSDSIYDTNNSTYTNGNQNHIITMNSTSGNLNIHKY